jgi:C1A family cysteine protease
MRMFVIAIVLLSCSLGIPATQKVPTKHARGRVIRDPAKLKALKAHSALLHGHKLKALPKATAASFDCRTLGWAPPVLNQGQCGSCWDFSGCETATSAFLKAGWPGFSTTDITTTLSPQFVLDCGQNGGCNGDDNTTVLTQCKSTGLPTTASYGAYQGQAGQCKSTSGMTLYKIQDFIFLDPNSSGVGDTQKIKDGMVAYGCVGCAVAAGNGSFWNDGAGTDVGTDTSIDHDILLVGWDDNHDNGDGSKGAWIMQNSWDVSWGSMKGCAWVKYGADSIGTEPVVAVAPTSPTPSPSAPVITSPLTASGSIGSPFAYTITATNNPTSWDAKNLPAGLTYVANTPNVTGTPTVAGIFPIIICAANAAGQVGQATLNITISSGPSPVSNVTIQININGTPTNVTLTNDEVQSVLNQSGAISINRDMKLGSLIDAFDKCRKEPNMQNELRDLRDSINRLYKALGSDKEPPLSKKGP